MAVTPELALHEVGNFSEYDGSGTGGTGNATIDVPASPPVTPYEGSRLLRAETRAAGEFARAQWNVNWVENDDVWYGGAVYFPAGFKAAAQGEVALLRWDIFGASPQRFGGLYFDHLSGDYVMRRQTVGTGAESVDLLTGAPADVVEGAWQWIDVRQKLHRSNGSAINELWVNGVKLDESTTKNAYYDVNASAINRMRVGIAATSPAQTNTLTLYMDRVYIAAARLGPLETGPTLPAYPRARRGVGM